MSTVNLGMPKPRRLSASSAGMMVTCHASAHLELAIPGYTPPVDPDGQAANIKGTKIHKIMEDIGEFTPAEMLGIAKAIEYVANLRKGRRFKMLREAKSTGWWLPDEPGTTADVVLYVTDEIHVIDYKFGRIPVEADDNSQGKYYSLSFSPLAPKAKGVTFHVVQPFADNIDSTFFTTAELAQFQDETIAAHAAIQAGDTTFTPSDYCTFCPANPHSRARKGSSMCPAMMDLLYPSPLDVKGALSDDD